MIFWYQTTQHHDKEKEKYTTKYIKCLFPATHLAMNVGDKVSLRKSSVHTLACVQRMLQYTKTDNNIGLHCMLCLRIK